MIENLKKVISKSATAYSGSVSRFYYGYVPQNKSFPYVSYYFITETYNGSDTGTLYGDVKLQFNVYSNLNDYGTECNNILQNIVDYYDTQIVNYSVGTVNMISCTRDFLRPPLFIEQVWQGLVQYNLHMQN